MNSRDRVLCALGHKTPDRCPLDLGAGKSCKFTLGAYRKVLEHFGITEQIRVQSKSAQTVFASDTVLERLESDVRAVFPAFERKTRSLEEWEDDTYFHFKDEWGTSFRMPKQDGKYYDMYRFPLAGADEEQDAHYEWPEPPVLQSAALGQAREYRAAGYPVTLTENFANGFLQTGPKIFGYEDWLAILASEEKRARSILDKLLARKMKYWDGVASVMGDSLDIVCEMDDLGTQLGPFISPEMFRRLIKPYYQMLFPYVKKKTGGRLFMHSCGSIARLIPDLIDVGVDIISPVQIGADGMDPAVLKREFGKDICFWGGGVDTQKMLSLGTPQQVRDQVKRNLEIWAKDGGYVFAAVHNIQANVPIENIIAMWEAFRDCRG
jgi:uroporphyrinogen decarboxylase